MATEPIRLQIQGSAGGAAAAIDSIGASFDQMAASAEGSIGRANTGLEIFAFTLVGIQAAIELAEKAVKAFSSALGGSIDKALELRGANDPLVQDLEELGAAADKLHASFGQVILSGLESADVLDDLTAFLDDLGDEVLDADTEIGQLVRQGFTAFIRAGGVVAHGLASIVQGFDMLGGAAEVATELMVSGLLEVQQLFNIGVHTALLFEIQNAIEELDRLEAVAQRAGEGGFGGFRTSQDDAKAAVAAHRLELHRLAEELVTVERQMVALSEVAAAQSGDVANATEALDQQAQAWEALHQRIQGFVDILAGFEFGSTDLDGGGGGEGGEGDGGWLWFFELLLDKALEAVGGLELLMSALEDWQKNAAKIMPEAATEVEDSFDKVVHSVDRTLDRLGGSLGAFVVSSERNWESLADSLRDSLASVFEDSANAFAAAADLPIFGLFGLGFLFSFIGGMIRGFGGGRRGGGGARRVEILSSVRPDSSNVVQHVYQVFSPLVLETAETPTAVKAMADAAARRGEVERKGTIRGRRL